MSSLIQNISDTAKWVAIFRAEENERPDAIFHDPFARRLAGEKGEQIANAIEFSRQNSWSFVARTYLFDEYIKQHVEQGYDTTINLAAGLDARPYRMDLPSSLKWIEVDLSGIIREKEKILADEKPNCELRRIQLDLSNQKDRLELFENLDKEINQALIVSEGLMIYLTTEEAATLASDLSSQKNFRRWLFDMQSPGLLAVARERMGSALKGSNAEFQFAPEEGEEFFLKYGWRILESKSLLKTAASLNRLNEEMMKFAALPEPEGPKGQFPWSGVCLFENIISGRFSATG
jgi:methyltransferase (TIGR00027 family)